MSRRDPGNRSPRRGSSQSSLSARSSSPHYSSRVHGSSVTRSSFPIEDDVINRRPKLEATSEDDVINRHLKLEATSGYGVINRRPKIGATSGDDVINRRFRLEATSDQSDSPEIEMPRKRRYDVQTLGGEISLRLLTAGKPVLQLNQVEGSARS